MESNNRNSIIINFGCRLNAYESEVIKSLVKKNSIQNTLIFNTCAVTKEAERQAQQAIRKYKKIYPKMNIIITGCSSQINPSKYLSMKEVNSIIGNDEKIKNETWSNLESVKYKKINNIMKVQRVNENIINNFSDNSRAYVEIQQGCNHRCTYCIIPFGRGNSRSVPINIIVKRIKTMVFNGFNEIVLTGVDITDYGIDLPGKPTFSNMVKRVLKMVPELKQLRLSSIDCAEIDDDFWDLIQYEERLMPHLHISLQSGDDLILKRMKRRHNRKKAIKFCEKAKKLRPDIVFGADLIAGFPTETDSMFDMTCSLIKECNLTYLHVFPYSQRIGTSANKMPQVSNEIKKSRGSFLRKLGEEQLSKYLKTLVGKEKTILIEKNLEGFSFGKTQEYAPVKINKILEKRKLFNLVIKSENKKFLFA